MLLEREVVQDDHLENVLFQTVFLSAGGVDQIGFYHTRAFHANAE